MTSHIVSEDRLGEPATNQELFSLLAAAGFIDDGLALALRRAAGFRNVLVHAYAAVDLGVVRDVVENHLGDLDAFVAAIRTRLVP